MTDGAEIATIADATILVHRAAKTTRDQAIRSIEALEKVGRRPVGVVLNMVTRSGGGRYNYEYGVLLLRVPAAKTPTPKTNAAAGRRRRRRDRHRHHGAVRGATVAAEAAPADAPKGRRARHRGRRAAAEQASAAAAVRASADAADTSAFTPVAETAAAQEPVHAEAEPLRRTRNPPARRTSRTRRPRKRPVRLPAVRCRVEDEFADEFADEFDDEYDDLYLDDPLEPGRAAADDDTAEIDAVQIDGQEELPLNERINGRSEAAHDHSLDEPLGARGERR